MNRIFLKRHIIIAVLLLVSLGAVFCVASEYIADIAVKSCFRMLRQSTRQFAAEVRKDIASDTKLLESTAQIISAMPQSDYDRISNVLVADRVSNLFSRMEMFLPDGRALLENGKIVDAPQGFSYAAVAAKGAHISSRETELDGSAKYIVRSYVPIVRDGKTEAMLCGVIDLAKIPDFYAVKSRFGDANVFLLEGKSGNFLLDIWHKSLGNSRILRTREAKEEYDKERSIHDMLEGTPGQTAFRSKTTGEFLYAAYESVGVNDWMAMLAMPESVVFADAAEIRRVLYLLGGVEAALMIAYFAWLLFKARQEAREKSGQLNRISYVLRVERILFDASKNPELIVEALREIADTLSAEGAFCLGLKNGVERRLFVWQDDRRAQTARWQDVLKAEDFMSTDGRLAAGESVVYDKDKIMEIQPEYEALARAGVRRLMLTPVRTLDGVRIGVLGVVNMGEEWDTAELLENVMLSFAMAMGNIEAYQTIRKMAALDRLTGLLNRNRFQKSLEWHEKNYDSSLTCIYIDADGLHEMNNSCGHVSGDIMLQFIADAIKTQFGENDSYRVGGDEFVAFCYGLDEDEIWRKIRDMENIIEAEGYHISVGVTFRRDIPLVDELLERAEQRMYEAKRHYYQTKGKLKKTRETNWRLEKLLAEKRDLEVFRAVIASRYKGVYIVKMCVDSMRGIYMPPYFREILEYTGGKFSAAMRMYIEKYVSPLYWEDFEPFLEYDHLELLLKQGIEPELHYSRNDGLRLLLRIYRSPEYSAQQRECIWSFENVDNEEKQTE